MKRTAALLLALAMVFVLAACAGEADIPAETVPEGTASTLPAPEVRPEADGSSYIGEWYDLISQRAGMDIKRADGGRYDVLIHWGSSAWESVEWVMSASYDSESGTLVYADGSERLVTYSDENSDPQIQVLYTDSVGSFRLSGDRITWTDDKDPTASEERVFLRAGEDGMPIVPEDLKFLGFYSMDDGSQLEISYNPDGTFGVDLSITRLAQFEGGSAVYDQIWDTLLVTATDPNGDPIEFKISKTEDGGRLVDVSNSVWELLPTGESFRFE